MFDPLGTSPFADDALSSPWPATPHSLNSPVPNLKQSSSSSQDTPVSPGANGPYGKEPVIYGQPESGLISPKDNAGANGAKYEKPEPYLRVRITLLDRNRRDILVRFDAQTNLPNFTGNTYRNISRSYAEFQHFYDSIIYSNPQTIVPALPLAQTSAPTDEEDDRLVKIMLQRWLTRVCEDPFLMRDEETRSFIESDFGYQPTPRTARKKASSGFSLLKRGVPDEDERLQRARFELTKLEGQFYESAKAIDKLSRSQKALSSAQAELGNRLVTFASTESHPPLASALRKFGRTWHSISDLDQASSISASVIIGDTFGYQGMNAKSAKETLLQRTSVLEEYQAAVKSSISKRRHIERLKASSNIRPDKVDEALEDLEEADKYEQILAQRVDGISQNLHHALQRHDKLVEDDVTTALIEHARSVLSYERQRLREFEALIPDFDAADKKVLPSSVGPPRPAFIPKLEDDLPKPIPARSTTPQGSRPSSVIPSLARPPSAAPALPGKAPPTPSLPPQSPGAGPSTPSNPIPSRTGSLTSPLGASALPSASFSGGRFVDGTKSMFITPARSTTPSTPARNDTTTGRDPKTTPRDPLAASTDPLKEVTQSSTPSSVHAPLATPAKIYRENDPLGPLSPNAPIRRSMTTTSSSPLSFNGTESASTYSEVPNGHASNNTDPLGSGKSKNLSQSMRLPGPPARPRLDAREAASKLANFF